MELIRRTVSCMTAETITVTLQIKQSKICSTAEPGLATGRLLLISSLQVEA